MPNNDDEEFELEGLQITEISGVSRGANLLDGWLALKKSASGLVTRQGLWSEIQRRADKAIQDDGLILEQKVARYLESPEGRALYQRWKDAPLTAPTEQPGGMTKSHDTTLREAAWSEIEKAALRLIESRPALGMHEATTEVMGTPAGKALYHAYTHPRYAHRPLAEVKQAVTKSAEDASLFHALGLIGG